ncbi:F-box/LRR-repeat protein 7 [Frankliniella fusca]|uniref:F-box/LRR-repeat protein 7 n=1 Tax=Frankliniella fusca TaxID=407009 RepID=A0AAE1LCK6_9NEOP|nr:F-box/LRR-repeat protein 7 [Frankliniella fusca]
MATAMETHSPHISDLPVDALLEVFSRLPAADLTQGVSGVCRAWQDLAMEPAAWRSRRVQVAPRKHRPLTAAERRVLRRAPALRALAVSLRRAQDLPDKLSAMLPLCEQLRELQLSLPSLSADMADDAVRHWPRLQQLRVEALVLQEGSLERLGQLGQLRALQLATLQPSATLWGPLRRAVREGFPSLRSLHLDARCDTDSSAGMDETAGVILDAAPRLAHLRLGALVPADPRLLAAAGQCAGLHSLHVEDCTALTDAGLLSLSGLRLRSLTLRQARGVSTAALLHFLRAADLSLLQHLDLSGCPALTDRVLRLITFRCSHPPKLVAEDCPNVSRQAALESPAPCTVAACVTLAAAPARQLQVV